MSLLNQFFGKRGRNNLRQRSIYESAHLICKILLNITSDRYVLLLFKRIFLSNSMHIFFFMKKKIIDFGVRTADIS